jgi:hypothetical protein
MAITLTTGTTLNIASTYGAAVTFTAASNANPCQLTTSTPHSFAAGDIVEVTSGWGMLNEKVVRCGTGTTGSTIVLEGVNTTDTNNYPLGAGIGSVREITAWTPITQIKSISAQGGEISFVDVSDIQSRTARQMPTIRSAITLTVDIFDDPGLQWYTDVLEADEARTPYALIMNYPNGSKLVANGYFSLLRVPTMQLNDALMTQISVSYAAEPIRYAN